MEAAINLAKRYKGALLDVDGVLIDSERLHYLENRIFFKRYSVEITRQMHIDYWIKETGRQTTGIIADFSLHNRVELQAARKERDHIFSEYLVHDLQPVKGALELLQYIHDAGILIVAVTSNYKKSSITALKKLGMIGYIEGIIAHEDVAEDEKKPCPVPYIKGAAAINIPIESCFGVEDTPKGIVSMKRANIGLAIACPNEWTEELGFSSEAEPHIKVDSLEEIRGLGLF